MIATRMAMLAVLGLAGALVGQQSSGNLSALPRALELFDHLPSHELQDRTRQLIARVRADESIVTTLPKDHPMAANLATQLGQSWRRCFLAIADYRRVVLEEGGEVSIAMMQLLLLSDMTSVGPGAMIPNVLREGESRELADALLLAAETRDEALLGHLYKLHEGDTGERIREATLLAQMEDQAAVIAPHLAEELGDRDSRIVQEAITALGMIGPAAKEAISALEKLAEHDDAQIAERAKAALRQIRGDGR